MLQLDGRALARGIAFGTQSLMSHQRDIDRINVFPIEDGDTGKNMAGTMLGVCKGLLHETPEHAGLALRRAAELAIAESRGCSGTILALFWEGFAEPVKEEPQVTFAVLARAARSGAARAKTGVAEPREGTILTVMARWAEAIELEQNRAVDLRALFEVAHRAAQEALRKTTEQMSVLEQRGVVDAGGLGFVRLVEGIAAYIDHPEREVPPEVLAGPRAPAPVEFAHDRVEAGAYCTECVVAVKKPIDREALEKQLASLGSSLIVVVAGETVKIHIHTDRPGALFDLAAGLGEVKRKKADDLSAQTEEQRQMHDSVAIVTDSVADVPEDWRLRRKVARIPIVVRFGEDSYKDKEDLDAQRFLQLLYSSRHHPTTAAPSVGDMVAVYQSLVQSGVKKIVSVHVTAQSSATVQNAKLAAERVKESGGDVRVIDTKSSSIGLGLIVWKAAEAAATGADLDEVVRVTERAVLKSKAFFYVDTLEYAVRGGRLPRPKAMFVTALGLRPLLGMSPDGKPMQAGVGFGEKGGMKKLAKLAVRGIKASEPGTPVLIGHVDALKRAHELAEMVRAECRDVEIHTVTVSAAQAAHIGPGAIGIGWLER